jgi:hypothetical protein
MKPKCYVLLGWALLMTLAVRAQSSLKTFFNDESTPLTYLGVDFTQAKVIGESAVPADMRDRLFPAINAVIINEPKKYDLGRAFHREVKTDITPTDKRNQKVDVDNIKSTDATDLNHLEPAEVAGVVKNLDLNGKKGIGLLFVMEAMSKPDKEASMYVVLTDMESKKVLLAERVNAKAQGFGFRNYWAYTVYKALEDIRKHQYQAWKAKNQ